MTFKFVRALQIASTHFFRYAHRIRTGEHTTNRWASNKFCIKNIFPFAQLKQCVQPSARRRRTDKAKKTIGGNKPSLHRPIMCFGSFVYLFYTRLTWKFYWNVGNFTIGTTTCLVCFDAILYATWLTFSAAKECHDFSYNCRMAALNSEIVSSSWITRGAS